ncbi:tRNA (adenine(22)-N(1))-methyltransferase [Xylocopilactobacillus apis]|uniref:SAM-dependent methyltransferase n=1 Tax=Xylocopilactobacillus apis TaxID=2932183 RepID=A0AAU9D1Z1_9LACO|nr:class I SAM-dependent methyltransferase [Xylocopilactobacillus apis]BDR56501.1 SAM-dependent methyltransferase [Xylocopilactobacillus apis]
MINIDLRLKTLANFVPAQSDCVADIGTDHAYLPIYLIQSGRTHYVFATDIKEGPLFNAKNDIAKFGLKKQIETRLGPGLVPIVDESSIDTVIISGMGGKLIAQIMEDSSKMSNQITYIFEPNSSEPLLRRWLMANNFLITNEKIIEVQDRIYEFIAANHQSKTVSYSEEDLLLGPILRKEKNAVFTKKWLKELNKRELVKANRQKSNQLISSKDLDQEIKIIKDNL